MGITLVLGNKNYSSWSLRAWLALRFADLPFEEHQVWIDEDEDRAQRREHNPTGKVPVLVDDGFRIWDSLAIGEYLAERCPDRGLWPADARARARARSICAEMHSGFDALRSQLPMNCRTQKEACDRGPAVAAEVARVQAIWEETRAEFGGDGALLFGAPTLADAFYAPVASRFKTYAIPLSDPAAAYRDAVLDLPDVRAWYAAAAAETDHSFPPYDALP